MPNRCVVYGCSNEPNVEKGIVLHCIPFTNDEQQETWKRRKKWIDFVQQEIKMDTWDDIVNMIAAF